MADSGGVEQGADHGDERPDARQDADVDADAEIEEEEQGLDEQARARNAALVGQARAIEQGAAESNQLISDQRLNIDALQAQSGQAEHNIDVDASDPTQRQQYQELREIVIRQGIDLKAAMEAGPKVKGYKTSYIAAAAGIFSLAISLYGLYHDIMSMAQRRIAFVEGPPQPSRGAIAKAWLAGSDRDFWNRQADYVAASAERKEKRPILEQIYWNGMTVFLANLLPAPQWTWRTPGDKLNVARGLARQIDDEGLPAAYRSLGTRTYAGRLLPRVVAADAMGLALTIWLANASAQAGSTTASA